MHASPLNIAVVGSGIAGLAAAWLLGRRHAVTLIEMDSRPGGHSNTRDIVVDGRGVTVDTGFIVYNERTYPNLCALFERFGVATDPTDMTFSVSLGGGRLEYSGGTLSGLLAQPVNLMKPRFWTMLRDLERFYRTAPLRLAQPGSERMTLGELLDSDGYGRAFRDDHLLPMAAAIWSAPQSAMLSYPAKAFVRFFENHGLLKLAGRPLWRTVTGGSRRYVERLLSEFGGDVLLGAKVTRLRRAQGKVAVSIAGGPDKVYDHVVLATHADQALRLLADADAAELATLGAFSYSRNRTVLHSDPTLMPKRRRAWSSWNYLSTKEAPEAPRLCVTYWMNRLQRLGTDAPVFVTLNPTIEPRQGLVHHEEIYEHPLYDLETLDAQQRLWSLQGRRNTWFCGAYFGAGFHEDGLQAGLAVAEDLGGLERPWRVANPSGRIVRGPVPTAPAVCRVGPETGP